MADDVSLTIGRLREAVGASSDADLARKLELGQSTISSWKKRGSVPLRYRRIADGAYPHAFGEPPAYWSAIESAALSIALIRYARLHYRVIGDNSFPEMIALVDQPEDIWSLVRSARSELGASTGKTLQHRVAALLHADCINPEAAIARDRRVIEENRPAVSYDGATFEPV